jgi:hypothetical protein
VIYLYMERLRGNKRGTTADSLPRPDQTLADV